MLDSNLYHWKAVNPRSLVGASTAQYIKSNVISNPQGKQKKLLQF